MKKFLPLLLIILLSYNIKAQITINSIDLTVGDFVLQAVDTNFQTALLSPGSDLSWDFSGVHGQKTDTIVPIDPTTTNHASSFTNANMAFGTPELAIYLQNNSNEFVSLGMGGFMEQLGEEVEMVLADPDTSLIFPLNYSDSRTADSWGETFATVSGQDLRVSSSVMRDQVCDAWGTVTTPHGTYEALRVQELEISIDSVFAVTIIGEMYQEDYSSFDTTYRYNFYTNDATIKYPLLEVKYDHNVDTIFETKWITFLPDNKKELYTESVEVSIYPNPREDFVNIVTSENMLSVNIYNTQGKIVLTSTEKRIDISNLPSSIYFIEVNTAQGIHKEKLLIE